MSIARSTHARAGAALAALALLGPAAPAAADGLPLPVDDSPNGVAAPDGGVRYLSVAIGERTAVLAQRAKDGAVTSRLDLRGHFGIPLVAYDSTAGGISADGRTLVLINPRKGFPRRETTFAILSTARRLKRERILRLRGDFSYDAISPDGRSLFLVNYISPKDPTKYRVRVYDLARDRLVAQPVVDPRELPGEMYGFPVTRVSSPDSRWAYTLYDAQGERPFIHALDTIDRKAVCIDLDGPAFASNFAYDLKLAVAAGGKRLDISRKNARIASVDTATFRAGPPAPRAPRAGAARAPAVDPAGPDPLWAAGAAGLLGLGLAIGSVRARRRRRASAAGLEDLLEPAQVLAVRPPHRGGHDLPGDPGEAGGLAAVSQGHAGRAGAGVGPGVGRLHRERPVGGAHDEPLARDELADLVGVLQAPAEELRDEREL